MSVEDVPFRQPVCLTYNRFVALHLCSSLILGVATGNRLLPPRQESGGDATDVVSPMCARTTLAGFFCPYGQ